MAWRFSVYLLPSLIAGCITLLLGAYAWRKRDTRAALPFAVMMFGLSVWSLGYGIELGFSTLEPMLLWDRIAFVGSVVVPTAWFLLAAEYAGYDSWMGRERIGALAVEPILTLALVWTNEYHGLIWRQASVDSTGLLVTPRLAFGPAYWANVGYSYLLLAAGIALFVRVMVRESRLYRRQSTVMVLGVIVPLGVNTAFNLVPRLNPVANLDLTTFALAVSGVFFALALFRFRLLDLAPVARETLVEGMDDGILVLDADECIVDANPAARRVLGDGLYGRPLARTPIGPPEGIDHDVVTFDVGERARTYEVSRTSLADFRGEPVGSIVLLRDITELQVLRDHEQRLSVLIRTLRHNIRNELNVVTGHSERLLADLPEAHREHVEAIDEAATRILDISEKALHVQETVGTNRSAGTTVDVAAVARATARRLEETYPSAAVHLDAPEDARASTVGRDQLAVALEAVGENAVAHNPAADASVWIEVECRRRTVRIAVRDDGPGIPDGELAAIESDRETPLEHSSGMGLWLTRWIVDASDGDLSVETDGAAGSVVSIELPRDPPADDAPGA